MKLINLTPHSIDYIAHTGEVTTFAPEGVEVRVSMETSDVFAIGDVAPLIRVTRTTYGEVTGLPAQTEGVYFIVSALIRQALPDRKDLLSPQRFIRDDAGRITGCQSFDVN